MDHARRTFLSLPLAALPGKAQSSLKPSAVFPLKGETYHVQGIELDGSRLWVTSVDAKARRGLLLEFGLPDGHMKRSVEIHDGPRYHPGGMSAAGDSLWIPVAEYKRSSSTVVQRRNKKTLALEAQWMVADHIGAVAKTPDGLIGANWDASDLYLWNDEGKVVRQTPNVTQVAFQDMKYFGGQLVASGLDRQKIGVILWLDWPSLHVTKRLYPGSTDRGVAYTHEGMALRDGKIWLLPEDSPSRLFQFPL